MSEVLFVWELGGGYGHLGHMLPLARQLRAAGHRVTFALKDLARARDTITEPEFRLLQAPVWLPAPSGMPAPASYAEILLHFGFLEARYLRGLVEAWRALFTWVKPALVVFNHSPTALLAAGDARFAKATIEQGFVSPPHCVPLPPLRWWEPAPARLADSERRALITVNEVRAEYALTPLARLCDLLNVDEDFLCTFSELDHYPQRDPSARYWGPMFNLDASAPAIWPLGTAAKVFAYLTPDYPLFDTVLELLAAAPCAALVHAPGLTALQRRRYETASLATSAAPVNMRAVRQQAALVLCHGPGTGAAALVAGIPLLLLPAQIEQTMWSRRVVELGAGIAVTPTARKSELRQALHTLLGASPQRQAARDFAAKHADFDSAAQLIAMAARCNELIAAARD